MNLKLFKDKGPIYVIISLGLCKYHRVNVAKLMKFYSNAMLQDDNKTIRQSFHYLTFRIPMTVDFFTVVPLF